MNFEEWMHKEGGLSTRSAKSYANAITGRLTDMAKLNSITNDCITLSNNPELIASKLKSLDEFNELNSTGHNMYSCALDWFTKFQQRK